MATPSGCCPPPAVLDRERFMRLLPWGAGRRGANRGAMQWEGTVSCAGTGDPGFTRLGEPSGSEPHRHSRCCGLGDQCFPDSGSSNGSWCSLSRGCPGAAENRVQVGQLTLYDHDQLQRVAEIVRHPKFNASLSAAGGADIVLLRPEALGTLPRPVILSPFLPIPWCSALE